MKLPIYLDYSATTPVDPRVAQKMSDCLLVDGNFGNPASRSHVFGWKAEEPLGQGACAISRVPLRRRPCYNARALLRVIPTKVLGLIVDLNSRE